MSWNSEDDLWAQAFANVGPMDGHQRRNDDEVSRAIHAISGIAPHPPPRRSENATGALKSMALET